MTAADVRDVMLALPGVTEHDHFGKLAYRGATPKGKPSKIFMTLWVEEQQAVLLLGRDQQAELQAQHPGIFHPVPNKWGDQGATFVDLASIGTDILRKALQLAMHEAGAQY